MNNEEIKILDELMGYYGYTDKSVSNYDYIYFNTTKNGIVIKCHESLVISIDVLIQKLISDASKRSEDHIKNQIKGILDIK